MKWLSRYLGFGDRASTLLLAVAVFGSTLGGGLLAAKYLLHALKSDAATPLLFGALILLYLTVSFASTSGRRSA